MLRLVLDTNVVLDLLYWNDPAAIPLLQAIDRGNARPLCDSACLEELRLVLRLTRFGLDESAQAELWQRYRDLCEPVATPPAQPRPLPRCKDADDQKFIELAFAGAADLLVTKDKALLALARRRKALGRLMIVTPGEAGLRLAPTPRPDAAEAAA